MDHAMMPSGVAALSRPRGSRLVAVIAVLAALYLVTGRLGLTLADVQVNATLVWPPTGLALAALVLFGRRAWPGVFIGAALVNASVGTALGPLLAIAVGNTLEAVIGATLLTHLAGFDPRMARLRDVIAFLLLGVVASTTISPTVGVGALQLAGSLEPGTFGTVWLIWWLGDAGGAIVAAPLLMVCANGRPTWSAMARRGETWAALLVLLVPVGIAFGGVVGELWESLLLALLAFPVVVWVGLRLGPRGAIVASFLVGIVALGGTAKGAGPFAIADAQGRLFLLWAYVAVLGAVAMILAAAIAEREDSDRARVTGERERARLSTQIRHLQRLDSLGLLAGGVAHDFNNLLVPIRANADLVRRNGEMTVDLRNSLLEEIEAASLQAADLCQQLLTYAGRHRPEMRPMDLAAFVREVASLLRTSIPRTLELRVETDSVPAIEGDRSQLGQVLMNLVVNAADSMQRSGGSVTLRVGVRDVDEAYLRETFLHSSVPAGRYVVLEVSDEGEGMDAEQMERIFDPFYTTKSSGRGLGMTSVLGIVNAHSGAIKVRSQPGVGSTFEVLLPAVPAAEGRRPRPIAPKTPPAGGGTVLLADDEDSVRRVTQRLLEGAGYAVIAARDGAEAVELFRERQPEIHAVVLDVSMPKMSGPDALARIKEIAPGTPAVLISGYDAGRVGVGSETPFVQKPFDPATLLEIIDAAVRRRR